MSTLLFDYDPLLYQAGAVGEERTIKVVHRQSGDEYEFATRTAFYGHWKKKAGGWLAQYNEGRPEGQKRLPEEFDIEDVQTPEPLGNCLHTLKQMIVASKEATGAKHYYGYSGRGVVFREGASTIVKYKGNREGSLRPVHLPDMKQYLEKYHGCIVVENEDPDKNVEADDMCTIDTFAGWKKFKKTGNESDKVILSYSDKDYKSGAGFLWHADSQTMRVQGEIFGELTWDATTKKVDGWGRKWLYFQVMCGDDADNYFANSANPGIKWADKSAYDILKDAKTDQEAWEALKRGYQLLYPSPKKIIGWRGYEDPKTMKVLKENSSEFEIEVDWLYVLQENFTLAKMLRTKDEGRTDVKEVMNKLGVAL
jgi:hypothetical protein